MRNPREPQIRVRPNQKKLGPEFNPWFWNPGGVYTTKAPNWFRERLHREMGSELEVTWNPINQRWQVFMESPRLQHPVCRGWKLLFIHNGPDGEYLPLDERIFARLESASVAKHGSAKAYIDRVISEYERDRAKKEANSLQDSIDIAMESWDHSRIKVAMRGKSSGEKFSRYHA